MPKANGAIMKQDAEPKAKRFTGAQVARAAELVLMPAHQPHTLKALTRFKMILTMIRS